MCTVGTVADRFLLLPLGKVIIHVLKSLSVSQFINATTERSIRDGVGAPLPTENDTYPDY